MEYASKMLLCWLELREWGVEDPARRYILYLPPVRTQIALGR